MGIETFTIDGSFPQGDEIVGGSQSPSLPQVGSSIINLGRAPLGVDHSGDAEVGARARTLRGGSGPSLYRVHGWDPDHQIQMADGNFSSEGGRLIHREWPR